MTKRLPTLWNGQEPAVRQHPVAGWEISWNPDNGCFHVDKPDGESVKIYADLRNARAWARKNPRE